MMSMNKYIPILFSIAFLNIKYSFYSEACKPKIAIIGAGIGGASASHFLTELFDKNVEIDIFEFKNIGGRLATINFGQNEFEAGGSILHPRNKYMKEFVKLLNLNEQPPSSGRFGIWNGKELVFEESDWEIITLFKLLYTYGWQPFYLHRYVNKVLDDFEKIYDLQNRGIAFNNATALLSAMNENFADLLRISIKDHMTNLGYEVKLIDELVRATLVVNYGQDTNIHAFVSLVSIAGAGFNLWSVKGGNKEVPKQLISKNRNVSVINANVNKIYRHIVENSTRYKIFYKEKENQREASHLYDIVIIAAPMTKDQETQIAFDGFEDLNLEFPGKYQTTIATFVAGDVNSSYFGLEEEIAGILSCDPIKTKISSIGKISSVEGGIGNSTKVWKIFSRQKLNDVIIKKMFSNVAEIKEIDWKAYPQYSSSMQNDNFKLDSSLYYVNAIEWAASAMEMSAISGRNAAILAFNDYRQKCSSLAMKTFNNEGMQAHLEL